MTVLVIEHENEAPPGYLGDLGLALRLVRPYAGGTIPRSLSEVEGLQGLVVLGGAMNANEDDRYPWLPATRHLIADAVREDLPTLLICLGHQLGAVALGGAVEKTPKGPLWGTQPVGLTDAGRQDELLRHLPADARVVHWNGDLVTELPPGAVVLALDPRGDVQAVRYGPRAWGLQCHPEAGTDIVARWAESPDDAGQPEERERAEAALAGVRGEDEAMYRAWMPALQAFAGIVRGGARETRARDRHDERTEAGS